MGNPISGNNVFECTEVLPSGKSLTEKLVVKFSKNQRKLENEICILREMKNAVNVPLLVGHGTTDEPKIAYYIMK